MNILLIILLTLGLIIMCIMCINIFLNENPDKDAYIKLNYPDRKSKLGTCEKCGTYDKLNKISCYNYFHDKFFDYNLCLRCEDDEHGLD